MAASSEFLNLLDKYGLDHNLPVDLRIEVARQRLVFNPADLEACLLAYGDVPKTYGEFVAVIDFLKNKQLEKRPKEIPGYPFYSLLEALQFLSEIKTTEEPVK